MMEISKVPALAAVSAGNVIVLLLFLHAGGWRFHSISKFPPRISDASILI